MCCELADVLELFIMCCVLTDVLELVVMCCVLTDVFCQLVILKDGCLFIHYTTFNEHRLSFHITIIIPHLHKTHIYFYIKPDDSPLGTKHAADCLTEYYYKINRVVLMVILLNKQKYTQHK